MNALLLLVIFIIAILMLVLLGVWTYRDAKSRGLEAGLWTAIVLLVPNLIGLLLYFLIGRRQAYTRCAHCSTKVANTARYCTDCGREMDPAMQTSAQDGSRNRKLLIIACACFVAVLLLVGTFATIQIMRDDSIGVSVGMTQSNAGRKWSISYLRSNKEFVHTIKRTNGLPNLIYIDVKCKDGLVGLTAVQGEKMQYWDFKDTIGETSIDLSEFGDGDVELHLKGQGATNVKFKARW